MIGELREGMMQRGDTTCNERGLRTYCSLACVLFMSLIMQIPAHAQAEQLVEPTLSSATTSSVDEPDKVEEETESDHSSPSWTESGLETLRRAIGATPVDLDNQQTPPPTPNETTNPAKQHRLNLRSQPADDVYLKENAGLISLTVREAPLRKVIALVAETQKLNLVFASPVDVPITASFDRIPWQQVIEALLSISGHTWTMNEGIIYVTSIESANFVSPEAGGRTVHVFELDFASAVDVDQTVKGLLSPAGKSWLVEHSTEDNRRTREAVAVVDYPANLARIADYICQMDQPPRQVLIEANILQIELSDDCRSGVDFSQFSNFGNNQVGLHFFSPGVLNLGGGISDPGNSTASILSVNGTGLQGLLEMLKTTTNAKTLASPKVLAVNGQLAKIQIGSQLGFRVTTTTQTSTLQSVQFLDVGVVLQVTPRITRDGRVLMTVKPEVSDGQLDPTTELPSKDTTQVATDLLLESGQGMIIGGLIQERDINTQSKLPWFGDLPYVGIVFQRRQIEKVRSEIIVTLIPYVLPYKPIIEERESQQYLRTQDRLLEGPLRRVPRPYEAQLYDTFLNPRHPLASISAARRATYVESPNNYETVPVELPAVEECFEYEYFPQPVDSPGSGFSVDHSDMGEESSSTHELTIPTR